VNEDLISRKHLKISLEHDIIFVEELGSSNGSWFNSKKLEAGKKTIYSPGDVLYLGKSTAGVSITIENIRMNNVQQKPVAVNSDNEKTLVHRMIPKELSQVETPTLLVANGAPQIDRVATRTAIRIVENETSAPNPAPRSASSTEHKAGLENKVKNLINQESDKLREMALKQSNEILQKAKDDEKAILLRAAQEAQDIINQSKLEAERLKQEASSTIISLQEKIRSTKSETDESIKMFKVTALKIESSIQGLKKDEEQYQQKIKFLEDNVLSIQEKIKNEHAALDDIKTQASTLRKNADMKFEEIVMEERRARARIETELIEAKTQTAKVFAEAEKVQAQKEFMESEISQMRSDKGQIERDINELHISFKRHEYEFEKNTREYNTLLEEKNTAQMNYESLIAEGKGLADKFMDRQNALLEQERELQEKVSELQDTANHIISSAKADAQKITAIANLKAKEVSDKSANEVRELDARKTVFFADLEIEKQEKIKEMEADVEKQKSHLLFELKKIEQKKESTFNETKWIEENAQKKCDKIIAQGQADADALKVILQKDAERQKAALELEFQTMKSQLLKENEILKGRAQTEVQAIKEKAQAEIFQLRSRADQEMAAKNNETHVYSLKMKEKADGMIALEKAKWEEKHQQLEEELRASQEILKRHEIALAKTEALKDENFIQANLKIQSIISDAHKEASAIEKESQVNKAKEQATLLEMRKVELEKFEELKAKFEQFKIDSRKETAEQASLAVQEFIINDMIKSRNLMLNEKLIKKFGERAKKLSLEAFLGRIQASETGPKPFPSKDYRKFFRWIVRLSFLAAIVYFGFYAWENYSKEIMMLQHDGEKFIKDNDIKIPDVPTKDQIIDFLR
jgi:pSer/pThr/pTyr-binding forkhead associated (FHA) protein